VKKKNKTGHDDSTEPRKRAKEALRESKEHYKELWERAPVAYHVLDPDGKIAKVNQTEASMLGYQVHEMVGKSIFDFILPEQRDEAQKRFCQKIQGLPIPRIENRIYLKKDGSRIYVVIDDVLERDAHKKITGIRSTMTDITDRKRIEEELLKSEKKYRSLVRTAGSGIAIIDQRGIFTFVNETLCRMSGFPEQELIGKHFVDFLHPDDRKNAIQIFENAFINPIGNPYIEFRIIHKDGRIVYMCSNPTAFKYENQLLGFNAIITDITERKRAEEEAVQHTKNIEFLSEAAMGFVELPAEKDIYWFIGEKLRQLINDAIYILVNSFDQKTGEIKVRALLADDRNRQAVSKTLGAFPLGISFVVSEDAWNGLINGKLVRVPGGIHELSFGKIPKAACDALEKLAGTGDIFTMGFTRKGELYGSATIIMREGSQLSNRDVVETLVRQAGVALQRKRAEEALRESQKRFQALTETTNDFIWEMDANGVYTYCSPQIYELWGYKPEEMIGRTPFDLMISEDREHAIKMFRTISESPSSFKGMETSSRDNTGRIVVLETSGVPFFDINGGLCGYRGISRDITEHKRAEEVVRKSEEKYRGLTENINLGIYRNTVGPEGKFIEANPAIIGMFGYESKAELLAINVSDLYQNPEDRNKFNDKMLKEGVVRGEELWLKKKDGSLFIGSVSAVAVKDKQGHVKYYDGIIEDITERKQVEDALRFTRLSLDNAADTMVCVGHDGRFVDINDAFCRSAGYSREELLSMTVHDIDPTYSVEVWPEFWKKLKQSGSLTFETYHHTKAGKVIPVEITAKFFEHNGKEYHCGFARDITERRQAEEKLRNSESQLRALSLELSFIEERERKRLASYLHDEIGQSLALLRMKFGSLAGVWKSKSRKQNIQQIRDLLEKVIDQTHTLTFELSPPVLHQLGLEAAIEWAGEKISQDFGIEFMFSDDGMIKPLSADIKALLFHCVRELMSNTVKHAKAKRMTVSLARREERVFVVVEDDGIGFDMSLPERQPKRTGFGLFSVRERLSEVGGSYEFHSEPGRGTRITLSVPLKEEMPSS